MASPLEGPSTEGNSIPDEMMDGASVQLWIYDLSWGWAKWFATLLCPRSNIDGIWHTSIVVHDKEIWFGNGITMATPGTCHLGPPHQIMALGTTQIDQSTLEVFLEEIKEYYAAEQYHLLGFNCNSFTNLCAQFLTGNSIPDTIRDLPIDFISTTLGWMASPAIQALYQRTTEPIHDQSVSRISRLARFLPAWSSFGNGSPDQQAESSNMAMIAQDQSNTDTGGAQIMHIAVLEQSTGRVLVILTIPRPDISASSEPL
ncbi:hypothetical protein FRC14_005565 [Serendipita sp. 396]|nr:hypothetical protein FRC14_005565 [Serendipita sp. 396]KAG8789258.1 hypothetical protein FRC15_010094 [Serendipita sp. 397]KAG8804476.1 hypothetical protein FRC16_007885 [Serendipita sp. 398]KAG8827559.1 hypothetical protein FRC19_002252 [Serendipita sp. 401]KAG8860681.1 hypothetical protein FRB91_001796 [Serendipita sp. 411]KAG8878436.1 hypothetical protein FRC20_008359 [Serendipita sp. 405]KAG9057960.1 hypothetical protein FS842_002652 [Serendipita sp. 407]